MKIGCMESVFHRFGEERYEKMKEIGFLYADLALDGELNGRTEEEYDENYRKEKALAAASGVTFHQVHGPWIYPPKDDTPEARERRADVMRRSLRAAAILGAPHWVIHPLMPFGTGAEPDYDEFWRINLDFFRALLPCARQYGVTICFENMPMTKLRISPPDETLRFIREMDDEHFQFCLDTGHSNIMGVSPAEAVRMAGAHLRVLHVHDNCGKRDEHGFPFFGTVDWREFMCSLRESGFDGVLSIESKLSAKLSNETSEDALRLLYRLAEELLNY